MMGQLVTFQNRSKRKAGLVIMRLLNSTSDIIKHALLYRVILKSLRDFRPLRYSSRNGHAEGEHVNRGIDTPSFCPTLQVLEMSTLRDAADVNPVIKFLPHTVNHVA
jgi:hypothetical protein